MSGPEEPARGRLLVVTGAEAEARVALGTALAARLGDAVLVDGAALERLVRVVPPQHWSGEPTTPQLSNRLLRWSAALAVVETYQLEGHDTVLVEDAVGDRLEDLLTLIDPEPVHLVVIADGLDRTTPRWGLWVTARGPVEETAASVIDRLAEALLETADPQAQPDP
ncbi:MAG: phosphotransferase (aminonucleoside antibiotic resistance) [Humibacillus sp.]|nr:phosphotransferase (aminonucleoside antibiotic resistance) [Humibacillus sp.]